MGFFLFGDTSLIKPKTSFILNVFSSLHVQFTQLFSKCILHTILSIVTITTTAMLFHLVPFLCSTV